MTCHSGVCLIGGGMLADAGLPQGSPCTSTAQCAPGMTCHNGICLMGGGVLADAGTRGQ